MSKQKNMSDKQEKTEQLKQAYKKGTTSLPQIPEKYQKLANLQYVRDENTRKTLMAIIDELVTYENLVLAKTNGHDLSVRFKGRQIAKICPLKKSWSASLNGGGIKRYTKEQILEQVKNALSHPSPNTDDELIKKLEKRIKKLSKDSKGISLKGVDISKDVEAWIEKKGYKMQGSTLLIK